MQRELAYLRPNVLLIFDRVRSTNAAYEKAWLLHSPGKPQTASETVVQGAATNGILTSPDKLFSVDSGYGGRLFVRTLLPASATIRKIGGTDYRYWSDGANRIGGASSYETSYAEPGQWRVEVVPNSPATDDLFLHALYITNTAASAMPTVNLVTTTQANMKGAQVKESGRERVALFSSAINGAVVTGAIDYDVTASGECGHLLTGVRPAFVYRVVVGGGQRTVISTAERTLYFTTTQTGALHVSITPVGPVSATFLPLVAR